MSEEQTQQLMYQMQMLETYLVDLTQKENSLVGILRECSSATESIKAIEGNSESETLVPVGMGTFMKVKVGQNEKFVVNVGAGVAIEKDKNSAINFIESKIKEMEVALKDTSAQKQEVALNLEHGKKELNRLMQQAGQQNQ